ncbi:MAG: hypothetical protein AAGJ31_02010 [Verrucomicrobiota bacterium]
MMILPSRTHPAGRATSTPFQIPLIAAGLLLLPSLGANPLPPLSLEVKAKSVRLKGNLGHHALRDSFSRNLAPEKTGRLLFDHLRPSAYTPAARKASTRERRGQSHHLSRWIGNSLPSLQTASLVWDAGLSGSAVVGSEDQKASLLATWQATPLKTFPFDVTIEVRAPSPSPWLEWTWLEEGIGLKGLLTSSEQQTSLIQVFEEGELIIAQSQLQITENPSRFPVEWIP